MAEQPSRTALWADRLSRWPRLARVLLTVVIALTLAAAVSMLLLLLIGNAALQNMDAAMLVLAVAVGTGLVAYVLGYWFLVGFNREAHPTLGARAVNYVIVGGLAGLALLIWLVISLVIALLPPEIPL